MLALFDDIAVFHNQNQIRIADGGKSVSNNKAGSSFHQTIHGLLDLLLRSGIYGAGRFIKYHYLIIRQYGTGDGKKLFLPLGNVAGVFIKLHLIASRQRLDKVMIFSIMVPLNSQVS